ncbi:hypothetical protein BGZ65_011338 [Modicella reniformis]|uniref:Uncharacterized protein n=1 Tax=Modicella reniformis TaxID=1440133 RepID=A0A9P6J3Y7_9FUNG|nr:hypothetical protein BGZ65_011338 [Modicella reniformis]
MAQGTHSEGLRLDEEGKQKEEEYEELHKGQQEEEDYIALEGTDDSDPESDIEIDLSTKPIRRTPLSSSQQLQRKVPKHFCKSNSKIYDNISVYAPPDSNLIFRCSQKRANWYLSRNLARSLSPTSIHLNFAPAGQGHVNDPYYLEERENKCVVCGQATENVGATMLHVVPEQYRKWFPIRLKSHSSHDILVACPECNAQWDREAAIVRKEIVKLYKIPLEGVGWVKDHDAGVAKRSAGAVVTDWSRQWDESRRQQSSVTTDNASQDAGDHDKGDALKVESITREDTSDQDSRRQRKARAKKQNVIPVERLQALEKIVYDWWTRTYKDSMDSVDTPSQLKRELPRDFSEPSENDDQVGRKKLKPESSTAMNASFDSGTTAIQTIPSEAAIPTISTPQKRKDVSFIEAPMPPPGHSTLLNSLMLEATLGAQASYKGPDYKEHGELVVARVMASSPEFHQDEDESQETLKTWKETEPLTTAPEGWRNVVEFIRTWRNEFLERIQPGHLSSEWKVENPA